MKYAFYVILKAVFVLKIFNFCLDFLGMWKDKVNFEIYDVTAWLAMNTHVAQYLTN